VRAEFERRFTAERMAHDYLDIYRKLCFARTGSTRPRMLNEGRHERNGERASRLNAMNNHGDPPSQPLIVPCTEQEKAPVPVPQGAID